MMPASTAHKRPFMSLKYSGREDFGAPRMGKYKNTVLTILQGTSTSREIMSTHNMNFRSSYTSTDWKKPETNYYAVCGIQSSMCV